MPGHKDWVLKALSDVRASKKLIEGDDEFLSEAAYHVHQSVEKSLKAILMYHHKIIPKVHDLEYLLEVASEYYFAISVFKSDILSLGAYEFKPRCPDDYFEIDREDVERGIKIAEQILKTVAQYMQVKL